MTGGHVLWSMAYQLTYQPLNRIAGVSPRTVGCATAAEAWTLYQQLTASDERVEIKTDGRHMGSGELQLLAEREAN
jgi:hypothetical protein